MTTAVLATALPTAFHHGPVFPIFKDPVTAADLSPSAARERTLGQSEVVQLTWRGNPERAFFEAGKYIADACDTDSG